MKEVSQLNIKYEAYRKASSDLTKDKGITWFDKTFPNVSERKKEQLRDTYEQKKQEVEELIIAKKATYPLENVVFRSAKDSPSAGYAFNFHYPIAEDLFPVDFFYNQDVGVLIKKTEGPPAVEVLGYEDERDTVLLHLPKGFTVPVGPVHFEEESVSLHQDPERSLNQRNKNPEDFLKAKFNEILTQKHVDRYCLWQPEVPEEPDRVGIDFARIKSYHMALTPEDPPVFTATKKIDLTFLD